MVYATRCFKFGLGIVFLYECSTFFGAFLTCEGVSMEPTVRDGDYLFVERVSLYKKSIKKGDIVVVKQPLKLSNSILVLKRINAVAGETVNYEDYRGKSISKKIPSGYVWLEGDNKKNSRDSREYGPVSDDLILYRAFLRFWPLTSISLLHTKPTPLPLSGNLSSNPKQELTIPIACKENCSK